MVTKNRLEKPFGPAGTSAGLVLFFAGIPATWYSLTGLVLVFIGAFFGFTSTMTLLDIDRKKVKYSNNLFGLIRVGSWIDVKPDMMLGLKRVHRGYRAYSRSNRITDIHSTDIRIMLYGANKKEILPISKFDSIDAAKSELGYLSKQLKLGLI